MINLNSHPKIVECVTQMLVDTKYKLPFYGQYNLMINFKEQNTIPTCGVNVTRKGMNFYYNTEFLNKLPQEEVNFIDIHEIFHLLFNHPKRTVSGRYNPHLANIAQDMLINSIIWSDINHGFVQIPKDEKGRNMALFLPKDYGGEEIFEPLYEWLHEKKKEHDKKNKNNKCSTCGGSGKKPKDQQQNGQESNEGQGDKDQQGQGQEGQGQGQGQSDQKGEGQGQGQGDGESQGDHNHDEGGGQGHGDGESCPDCNGSGQSNGGDGDTDSSGNPSYGNYGKAGNHEVDTHSLDSIFDNIEKTEGQYMDSHIEDTVPEELRETMVKEAYEKLKARGLVEGNLEQTINKLRKKRKDYLKEIKRSVSNVIGAGNKHKTITRLNRRGIKGLKGNKKVKSKINVILDTSGSMGGMFEKVLSYVFQRDIEINLLQCDTKLQGVEQIKSMKQLEKVHIRGLGGTVLMPGVRYICEEYNDFNTVILTDGWTDSLDLSDHKGKVLILTTADKCNIIAPPKKGVKQIWIDTSYD